MDRHDKSRLQGAKIVRGARGQNKNRALFELFWGTGGIVETTI